MKRNLLFGFLILTTFGKSFAQSPLVKQWDYRFGGTDEDALFSFQQTADGGYILGGRSKSGISGDKTQNIWDTTMYTNDYWIIKLDSLGIKQWDKDYGGTNPDVLVSLQQTTDRGYILGGFSISDISGDKTQASRGGYDYWIVKLDSLGNKQWDKDFGGTSTEELWKVQQTADGGYILGGHSNSGIGGDKTQDSWGYWDYWIVKTDSLGNKLWDKDFGGTDFDILHSLQQTTDGGYILGGSSLSGISGNKTQVSVGIYDYWIVKTDSLGNYQWDKDFGGTDYDLLASLKQTTDGGYIFAGISNSGISGNKTQNTWGLYDFWIVKIDSLGNQQWDKDFGGTDYEDELGNISKTSDGGYLIAGTSYSNISGDKTENNLGVEQAWIVKIDSFGIKQWDKTIFNTAHDEMSYAIQTMNGCYVIANYTQADIGGYKTQPNWDTTLVTSDYWITKLCDTTSTTSINQISNIRFSISIYPNPTNSILNLFANIKENIIITNLLGKIVLQKTVEGKVELDVSFLSAGIYFIRAGNEMRKFVKE